MQGLGTFSPSACLRLSTTRPEAGPGEGDRSDSQCCSLPPCIAHTCSHAQHQRITTFTARLLGPAGQMEMNPSVFPSSNKRRHCQAATRCDRLPVRARRALRPNDPSWLSAFACCHKSPYLMLPDAPSQQTSRRRPAPAGLFLWGIGIKSHPPAADRHVREPRQHRHAPLCSLGWPGIPGTTLPEGYCHSGTPQVTPTTAVPEPGALQDLAPVSWQARE